MAVFTLRSVKNAPLTNDEVDGTFQYLKDEIDALVLRRFENSAQLALLLNDETGSGKAVFNTSPTFLNGVYTTSLTFELFNTNVTTLNFAGEASAITVGAVGGTTTFRGDVEAVGNVVSSSSSDISLKDNVQVITGALDKLKAVRGVTWDWKEDVKDVIKKTPATGVIAQEVEATFPEVVTEGEDGLKRVYYDRMIGLLIEAIKELNDKIDRLEQE